MLRIAGVPWIGWGMPESIERTLLALNQIPPWQAGKSASAAD